jgi:hypothetical protein
MIRARRPRFIWLPIEPASRVPGLMGVAGLWDRGMFVTRMDSSLALPLCALSGCRSLRMQSLIRVLSVAALILAGSVSGVKAAGLLDGILGLFGLQAPAPEVKPDPLSYGKTYCVRLCDGSYYPVASAGNATPVQMCSAMCPAAKTGIFRGGEIDTAMGLTPVDVMADPTLQPGDIVATADGLKVFQGAAGEAHRTAEFTPIAKSAWVSRDVRSRLSKVKVSDKQ